MATKIVKDPYIVSDSDLVPAEWYGKSPGHTVEEWGQKEYDSGSKAGRKNGLMEASNWVMQQAVIAFQNKDDDKADLLRLLSDNIRKLADK